jgi:hypothetical protein
VGRYRQQSTSSTTGVLVLAVLAIAAVGVVDYLAGLHLSLSLFYLLPVALVTWRSGPWAGAAAVAAVLAFSLAADLAVTAKTTGSTPTTVTVVWNALMRAAASTLVVFLVHMQRRALHRESILARTDPLTGLANRRQYRDALTSELHRCQRYHRPFAVVLVDVDRFKDINDRFGHDTGDLEMPTHRARRGAQHGESASWLAVGEVARCSGASASRRTSVCLPRSTRPPGCVHNRRRPPPTSRRSPPPVVRDRCRGRGGPKVAGSGSARVGEPAPRRSRGGVGRTRRLPGEPRDRCDVPVPLSFRPRARNTAAGVETGELQCDICHTL